MQQNSNPADTSIIDEIRFIRYRLEVLRLQPKEHRADIKAAEGRLWRLEQEVKRAA